MVGRETFCIPCITIFFLMPTFVRLTSWCPIDIVYRLRGGASITILLNQAFILLIRRQYRSSLFVTTCSCSFNLDMLVHIPLHTKVHFYGCSRLRFCGLHINPYLIHNFTDFNVFNQIKSTYDLNWIDIQFIFFRIGCKSYPIHM